ncbi:probable ATP-dependent RNA helicase DDX4 [Daphnia carinata]|uniref:probable ATP-dependent RNA helicase DDX4 n=1 Tax=Daphnia carinata TaxID=120202 RepID=UPI002868E2FB|nr:probable ATP-dependent RNA helicase DDX4 [Daphnia carinata]
MSLHCFTPSVVKLAIPQKAAPNLFSGLTKDGKLCEKSVPQAVTCDEKELFKGIVCGECFKNFDKVVLQVTGKDVPQYITSFEEAGLRQLLLQNMKDSGYIKPTPVQKVSVAVVLAKRDLIACAVMGSGKTAGYLVPVMNILLEQGVAGESHAMGQMPELVTVAPTRELAIQIHREACKFSYNSVLKSVIIYGGTVTSHQRSNLQLGSVFLSRPRSDSRIFSTVEYLSSRGSGFKFWTKLIECLIWISAPMLKKLSTIQGCTRKESVVFVCVRLHSQMK